MELHVYPNDLNEHGKNLHFHPEEKKYFIPSVQATIEKVWECGGRVIYYACDRWNSYRAIVG